MATLKLQCTIGSRPKGTYELTYTWPCEVPEGLTYTQEGLLQKGFGEFMRDATSTAKGTDAQGNPTEPTPEDRDKAAQDRLKALKAGTYTFGAGGGSSTVDAAWGRFFRAMDHKENGKLVNQRTLERAKHTYARQVILAEDSALTGDDLKNAITAYKEEIWNLQEESTSTGSVGYFVEEIKEESRRKQAEKQATKSMKLSGFSIKKDK